MSILARGDSQVLADASSGLVPRYTLLRGPEAGLVMLQGRAGGSGHAFNLGEATVVRCSVQTDAGYVGHSYSLGRDLRRAELTAAIDAGLQDETHHAKLYERVIAPLAKMQAERRAQIDRRAAATQVEFFTMSTMRT